MQGNPSSVSVRLRDIAALAGGELHGADATITGVSSLADAASHDLVYVASDRFLKQAVASKAAAFVVGRVHAELNRPQVVVENPAYAFA